MGIEPTYPAWKAGVLPLNYTRTARALQPKDDTTGEQALSIIFYFFSGIIAELLLFMLHYSQ